MQLRSFGIGLVSTICLIAAGSIGCAGDNEGLRPTSLRYTTGNPLLVTVLDEEGHAAAEWHGLWAGSVKGWTEEPEYVLFVAGTVDGPAVVAGDPESGRLYRVALTSGSTRTKLLDAEDRIVVEQYGIPREVAAQQGVAVTGVVEPSDPETPTGFAVAEDGAVLLRGRVALPARGLVTRLTTSPSGRWTAVAQALGDYSYATYRISPDGSRVTLLSEVEVDVHRDVPKAGNHGSEVSPDGRWRFEIGVPTRMLGSGGEVIEVDLLWFELRQGLSTQVPVWAPDSKSFALLGGAARSDGILVVNLDGSVAPVVIGNVNAIVDWTPDGISWVGAGPGGAH